MVHDTVDIFLQILDLLLSWVLMMAVKFCSRVTNTVLPQDIIPRFSGMNFGVAVLNTCRCSNLPDKVLDSRWPLRLIMHTLNLGVILFHPNINLFTILSCQFRFRFKHSISSILLIQSKKVEVRVP